MKFTLGVCAMESKVESSPMKSILKHLEDSGDFIIIIFPEEMILNEPITKWPVVECLISFYSVKFPQEKAIEYVKLVKPIILNDLEKQRILRSRINVYRELQACRIPHPNYLLVDHEMVKKGLHTFEEHYDYIVYNNVRLNKPFIEKPIDSDDHNNWIYYPSNTGGGCKKLFRKIHDRSSKYCPEIHNVRRNGTYIYEEFMLTFGTDIKVYAVGSMFAHAEARKSPTLDGKVKRYSDGKEYRYPVILTSEEKTIAYRIVDHFKQTVCGFDILRTFDGPYVCDVNGWSFVKRNKKYHIDCSQIIRAIFLLKLQSKYNILIDGVLQNKPTGYKPVGAESGLLSEGAIETNTYEKLEASEASDGAVDESGAKGPGRMQSRPRDQEKSIKNKSHEELCSVIVVMRHADRRPKNKLKFFTQQKEILNYFKGNESEVKLKSTEELIKLNQLNDQIIEELEEPNRAATTCVAALNRANSNAAGLNELLVELNYHKEFQRMLRKGYEFSGINRKVQLKAVYKPKSVMDMDKSGTREGTESASGEGIFVGTTKVGGSTGRETPVRQLEKVLVVAKWGGDLTDVGKSQAEDLGRRLRQTLYPADSSALIRLHSTYRHDFKIFSSDEGRCQITGAAFTKGILDLEGELTPILVAMTIRNKKAYQLLNETVVVEERSKCRYKLDELITHHGTPEYDEILQELSENERYYYSKALEDADFSQDDLVNLSNLIRYYINTIHREETMWSSLYSVDDYAFHIVNKLSSLQTRWTQLLLKFHRPSFGGFGRVKSGGFYKSHRGLNRVNSSLLERIYGDISGLELDSLYGANTLDPSCAKNIAASTRDDRGADAGRGVSRVSRTRHGTDAGIRGVAGDNGATKTQRAGHATIELRGNGSNRNDNPANGGTRDGTAENMKEASFQSGTNYSTGIHGGNKEHGTVGNNTGGMRTAGGRGRTLSRDEEMHSSDYCPEERYDYTKLSDIVDNIRYDLIHLHHLLGQALEIAFEIYRIVERLSSVISPCEYGVTPMEKLQIGAKIAWNLLKKIQHDVSHQRVRMSPYTDQEKLLTSSNASTTHDRSSESTQNNVNVTKGSSPKTVTGEGGQRTVTRESGVRDSPKKVASSKATEYSSNAISGTTHVDSTSRHAVSGGNGQYDSGAQDTKNLNVSSSLEHLEYDIDFMVNNDTSASSIAVNSLASSGTYLDSSKIFETGKCFIGGVRPTEMYLFNSSTRTEILWYNMRIAKSVATGTKSKGDSRGKGKAYSSNSSDSGKDESVILNSYSLWSHLSPSNSMENITDKSVDVSKTTEMDSSTVVGADEAATSSSGSTKWASREDTSKAVPVMTGPKRSAAYNILTATGTIRGKNDGAGNMGSVNLTDLNQGWGWDEKIFDELVRLGTDDDLGIRSQQRVVRSRYYVTSASHMFSVFNFFKYAHLLDDSFDTNLKHIESINDLHYLSHIVLRVWRSRSSEGFFNRLEILVSSGAKDGFGQNLSLLEQSAKNQKNKYKRHIQRYKLRTLQSSNCSYCPITLNRSGSGRHVDTETVGRSNDAIGAFTGTGTMATGSDIVDKYNLMVTNPANKKFKCFKCFLEQYKLSEASAVSSPIKASAGKRTQKKDHASSNASNLDTAGSCASGVDNREDDGASNKTVPPYCELNNLVLMNRNFGLDRLNNLIQRTYEEIISKG
ncbi:uncharacterized protein TOT_010001190 [Theileria orientalis strain Shintoku]|uniref:Inositol hexakisphosphate and diphosphoinositol-pentakisphosphate kinase n=1 Tax=Theileria orientalis strain Shintoku TaxID=869250 RepID=J4C2S2_THEOR|nr:uncharacterized protein TOT_010001190 [Theileria orientalis strain Shintoku]BAM39186.1 uncharacterized protein TOT_010001190 [Theileria orientalis strain Shintoku]|eukprot:XP_009689487.1 uncharacterized protein TOT_010001190 [Theileria orientalis strain Shintoku]